MGVVLRNFQTITFVKVHADEQVCVYDPINKQINTADRIKTYTYVLATTSLPIGTRIAS